MKNFEYVYEKCPFRRFQEGLITEWLNNKRKDGYELIAIDPAYDAYVNPYYVFKIELSYPTEELKI